MPEKSKIKSRIYLIPLLQKQSGMQKAQQLEKLLHETRIRNGRYLKTEKIRLIFLLKQV
jgi:hypothetical protein